MRIRRLVLALVGAAAVLGGLTVTPAGAVSPSFDTVDVPPENWTLLVGGIQGKVDVAFDRQVVYERNDGGVSMLEFQPGDQQATPVDLGGIAVGGVGAVGGCGGNCLDVVVQGQDHGVWVQHVVGDTPGTWTSLGGFIHDTPAVVSHSGTTLDVFARGGDNQLYWRRTNQASWVALGGLLTSGPSVARTDGGKSMTVAVRGGDGAVWTRTTDNANASLANVIWGDWVQVPNGLTPSTPEIFSNGDRIDLLVHGNDNGIWFNSRDVGGETWSGFTRMTGLTNAGPGALSPGTGNNDTDGTFHFAVRGVDGNLWAAVADWQSTDPPF